jgi:hypothetical protein
MHHTEETNRFSRVSGMLKAWWSNRCSRHAIIILSVGAFYILFVHWIALLAFEDQLDRIGRRLPGSRLQAQARDAAAHRVPTLVRWDAFWYLDIASQGYGGEFAESEFSAGFYPLFPWVIRFCNSLGMSVPFASLFIPSLCTCAALVLLALYDDNRFGIESVTALLAFPSAFILLSAYSEGLFALLALAAFYTSRKRFYVCGCVFAFLAGMTRINGISLVPALALLAWQHRSDRGGRCASSFLPAIGALGGQLCVATTFYIVFGSPLAYFTAKRENWGTSVQAPWNTVWLAVGQAGRALESVGLGRLYVLLELPTLQLVLVTVAVLCARRKWPEAVFVLSSVLLSLSSGSLWGLPRFVLPLFPVFLILGELSTNRVVWYSYLVVSSSLQVLLIYAYVGFQPPAP